MPEKNLDGQIFFLMIFISALAALAKVLSDEQSFKVKHLFVQLFVGVVSGIIFGFFTCWFIGENVYAVGAVAGAGAVLGIKGLTGISLALERKIKSKLE